MERNEFEAIRDLPGKVIRQDIRFVRRDALRPAMVADDIRIENDSGVELVMSITWNPEKQGKTVNVHVRGLGSICRLDVLHAASPMWALSQARASPRIVSAAQPATRARSAGAVRFEFVSGVRGILQYCACYPPGYLRGTGRRSMITITEIRDAIGAHCMVWADSVEEVTAGRVRIETKFLYPDGGSVDLWLVQDTASVPQLRASPRLTDLGETMTWLFHAQIKPWTSDKRQSFIRDVLEMYQVERDGGQLVRHVNDAHQLGVEIIRLGQACMRISDLVFTKRMAISSSMTEHVEAALDDADLPYKQDVELVGRFGKNVRLDFLVESKTRPAGILALTSTTKTTAHYTANEIFTKWYDLQESDAIWRRVTVFDDRQQWYRDEDLERLEQLSTIVPLSNTRHLVDVLVAT